MKYVATRHCPPPGTADVRYAYSDRYRQYISSFPHWSQCPAHPNLHCINSRSPPMDVFQSMQACVTVLRDGSHGSCDLSGAGLALPPTTSYPFCLPACKCGDQPRQCVCELNCSQASSWTACAV